MAGPGNIVIKIGAEAGQAVRELATVDRALGSTATTGEKMHAGLTKAALPAAAALGAIAYGAMDAAKAAAEDAQQQAVLANTLKNTTGATDAQVKSTESWIASMARATGVSDEKLRPALGTLLRSTGDVTKSQELLQNALDISAATGKDVGAVSAALAKGYSGQTSALTRLVPGISQAAKESKDFSVIMDEVNTKTGGAAAANAATAAGQFAIFKDQTAELKESLGAGLLPVLASLMPMLLKMVDFAAQNTTAIKILIGIIAALAAGILVANAALKLYAAGQLAVKVATAAWTAAQWLLNAALSANPIGLVIVAIGALVAALVVAYTKSETFRNIVNGALNAVLGVVRSLGGAFGVLKDAAASAFEWIVGHWKVALFAFGPIGAAAYLIATNFDKVKAAAEAAFGAISSAISGIVGAIEAVIAAVERLISALGKIHVPHISLPGLPFSLAAPASASPRAGARAGGVAAYGAGGVTVNVYGSLDPEGTARAIKRVLADHDRRMGR